VVDAEIDRDFVCFLRGRRAHRRHLSLCVPPPRLRPTDDVFGRYIEVIPNEKIVWTNEEDGDAGSITTLTLEERGEETLLVIRDLYPNKAAADEAVKSGAIGGFGEMFEQLDELLASLS